MAGETAFNWGQFLTGYSPNAGGTGLFGEPIPGILPGGGAIGGLGGIVGGAIDLIGNKKRRKTQEGYLKGAQQDISKYRSDFAKGIYNQQVSQAQRDLAMAGIRPTDTSGIMSSSATALQAASADPRLMAGLIGGVQKNQAQMLQQQQMADTQRELASRRGLADLEQDVLSSNLDLKKQMGLMGLNEAMASRAQAMNNIEALQAEKRQAFQNILGGVTNIGMSLASGGFAKDGAKVKKTPGEFNHKTNPIHMLKDGKKVGEMTGGEYIINPKQADAIEDAYEGINDKKKSGKNISREELMMLYNVVRGIFSQPQFKD